MFLPQTGLAEPFQRDSSPLRQESAPHIVRLRVQSKGANPISVPDLEAIHLRSGTSLLDSMIFHPITWAWTPHLDYNFDVYWNDSRLVSSSHWGYGTTFGVDDSERAVAQGGPISLLGVSARTVIVSLSPGSLLVLVILNSSRSIVTACDVAIWSDVAVADNDTTVIGVLPNGAHFAWTGSYQGSGYRMNIIGRYYPLVSDISAYWYGPVSNMIADRWSQTSEDLIGDGTDVAMSFSWQDISLPGHKTMVLSVIFRSGDESGDPPIITLNVARAAAAIRGLFSVDDMIDADFLVNVFVVVDGHLPSISRVAGGLEAGSHQISVSILPYKLSLGNHTVSFYAVDEPGFVSDPWDLPIDVIPDVTPTVAVSPTMTKSPLSSQSPAAAPSPYAVGWPVEWTWQDSDPTFPSSFDISWRRAEHRLVSSSNSGYSIRLHIG
jgi:hypothetical protein